MQVGQEPGRPAVKLRAKVAHGDGFIALRLEGVIDEHNSLGQMVIKDAEVLCVDLGGVKRLNSVGVRDWVNWLRAMRARFKHVVLYDCPAPVMNEVNFVRNFAEGAHITTFVAPLFCTRCNKEESRLLDTQRIKNGGAALALPSFLCERSDCENALDDDEDSYFGFMRTLPDTAEPERFKRLTEQARALLASSAAPVQIASEPLALSAHDQASPARNQPLGQLGLGGVPRRSSDALPIPVAAPAELSEKTRGDWLFIAAMAAMLAVLGVLLYLILTLE